MFATMTTVGTAVSFAQDTATEPKAPETKATDKAAPPANEAQDLAKKLSNPVANLISVPLQSNFDCNIGPADDGCRFTMNLQPVIPISIADDWNVISRTILPITYQNDIFPGAGDQFGLGDTVQSFFFSPKNPSSFGGIIWGIGPAFLLPTGTDKLLSSEKFGVGPTAVILKQAGHWTVGALMNQIWSVAGDEDRADVSSLFLQPFISYTTTDAWTFTLNTESTYDWETKNWSVPVNALVSKLVKIENQPISLGAGLRYWAESPDETGPEGFGGRLVVTFLFPKG
ncbi:MAG TPA: transporter [Verrucomicrobiae bacterium]|nr:transporter [Verrucomicrobiae bacterium]